MQPLALPSDLIQAAQPIRRGLAISLVMHLVLAVIGYVATSRGCLDEDKRTTLIDVDIAPPAPPVEALPAEQKRTPEDQLAQGQTPEDKSATQPTPGEGEAPADAGIDAPIDAPPDAPVDAAPKRRRPDAAIDAGVDAEPLVADHDGGVDDAGETSVAVGDAGAPVDGEAVATGSGSGVGSGSGSGSLADEASGSGSAKPGVADEVAVEGAPTTAGTAANLLAYFPKGHRVTVLIRFDRLRGTEWLDPTERLFKPMPDYRRLFGGADAKIGQKVEMLVISTPEPQSAIATTLVARTKLDRASLRTFLTTAGPVTWTPAKGGLLGRRSGSNLFPGDKRVFLSPFRGWFLLAQPADLPNLMAPATGSPDAVEASVKLPAWLHSIRKIEEESGLDARGPALVLTMDLGGKRLSLGDTGDFGLGVKSVPMPQRISVAAEIVKQGWLVRGNIKMTSVAEANELVATANAVKQRIADSTALQYAVGKPIARIVANLSFAKAGDRVSYATSVSIGDMHAVMAVATQLLDAHFANAAQGTP